MSDRDERRDKSSQLKFKIIQFGPNVEMGLPRMKPSLTGIDWRVRQSGLDPGSRWTCQSQGSRLVRPSLGLRHIGLGWRHKVYKIQFNLILLRKWILDLKVGWPSSISVVRSRSAHSSYESEWVCLSLMLWHCSWRLFSSLIVLSRRSNTSTWVNLLAYGTFKE